jgi:hypothetical protein
VVIVKGVRDVKFNGVVAPDAVFVAVVVVFVVEVAAELKVKEPDEVTVPPGVVILIFPVAPPSTMALICVAD